MNRHVEKDGCYIRCVMCGSHDEIINHYLFFCNGFSMLGAFDHFFDSICFSFSKYLWNLFETIDYISWRILNRESFTGFIHFFSWLLWCIKKVMNNKLFNGVERIPKDILDHALREVRLGLYLNFLRMWCNIMLFPSRSYMERYQFQSPCWRVLGKQQ